MCAIRWGSWRTCPLTFSDGVDTICNVPHLFLSTIFIRRGFKNESDVCRVLCEELFKLDVTHSQVDVETNSITHIDDRSICEGVLKRLFLGFELLVNNPQQQKSH